MQTPSARHMVKWLLPIACAVAAAGCASWPPQQFGAPLPGQGGGAPPCDKSSMSPADNTRLSGIEQSITEGKYYAALAQLDALGSNAEAARIIRADALRRIGKESQARAIYEQLLGAACVDGRARHGLGLLHAQAGDLSTGLTHLRLARESLPLEPRIRNDLGYALLMAGQLDEAQFEFLTVLDLSPNDPLAGRNLVLLLLKRGQAGKAQELAQKLGMEPAQLARLQHQVQSLGQPDTKVTDNTGGALQEKASSPATVTPHSAAPSPASAPGVSP